MAAPFEFSSSQLVKTFGTSGNVPVNVAINVPAKKVRKDEFLQGAGLFLAGVVLTAVINRFAR